MGAESIGEHIARTIGKPEDADIIDGYFDGHADDRVDYPEASNRSQFYRHGWLNGRDDRIGTPRASAQQIRDELAALSKSSPGGRAP